MGHGEVQLAADNWQQAAKASRHMPAASLGHYAALSVVVRGGSQESEVRPLRTDDRRRTTEFGIVNCGFGIWDLVWGIE